MSELRELRIACEARLAGIEVPIPFNLDTFVATMAAHRGRPILLRATPVPASPDYPSGVWKAAPEVDFIYVDTTSSTWHQEHVVCHEIGHMLWGHTASDTELDKVLLPDLDPATVLWMLGRHEYTSEQEQQAEMMATVILARAGRRLTAPSADPGTAAVAAALFLDHV
ncbi:MAG: hypothetical protein H0T78_01445 [Longispora sp.]|nr:hypothetical protein [Longispora sp. (in: high G+C Gram-positive bacteria)]